MNILVPLLVLVVAATVSAQYNVYPEQKTNPGLQSRVNKLTQLAQMLKEGVRASTTAASVRPLHVLKELPRTPDEDRVDSLERTYARRLETYLANKELEHEELSRKAAPSTALKSKEWSQKVLASKGTDKGARERPASYSDRYSENPYDEDYLDDDDEDLEDDYDEDDADEGFDFYEPRYAEDIGRYDDVTSYLREQQLRDLDSDDLRPEEDLYADEGDDDELSSHDPLYDEDPYEAEASYRSNSYPQTREAYRDNQDPYYSRGAIADRSPNYVGSRRPVYERPQQYYPTAKNVQAQSSSTKQYQPAPQQLSPSPYPVYRNQYQKELSYVDDLYEPGEYRKLLDQARYSQSKIPSLDELKAKTSYGKPIPDSAANNATAAAELTKPDQASNATNTDGQTPYVKVALLPDKDVMVVIQSKNKEDTDSQGAASSQSSAEDQSSSKAYNQPAQQGDILIPAVNADNIMTTYVDSKPAEVAKPAETIAKLSATRKHQHQKHQSPVRHKVTKQASQGKNRASLSDVVRNYLQSRSN